MSRRIQRAVAYIDANLHRHIGVDELAGVAAMSKFHFARRFKRTTGRTPKQYVAGRRLNVAKAHLRAGVMPLAEVAHSCGYASQSHMNSVFMRLLGVTPGAYRRAAG